MDDKGTLIVISGFSGAGKGTIVKKLINTYDRYALSISMTTRAPREGERDGVEYFFSTKEQFEEKIKEGGFIEHACYCGNYYGTPRAYVEKQLAEGKDVILEIEIQGALQVKERFPESLLLFVTPPTAVELENRLRGRKTETEEQIAGRLSRAYEESEGMDNYDYIIINDNLDKCVEDVHSIALAAKCEPIRKKDFIKDIRNGLKAYSK
ncbi:MAG: guanylate kinase [Lachnospiraceae bacterium]|nr:guanylate kinase [Lachnospiraceae bacterium]